MSNAKKSSAYGDAKGDTTFRRKFTAADYEARKRERELNAIVHVASDLRPDEINFEAVVNKVQIVSSTVRDAGFNCAVCSLVFKDNVSFLDHLTSKQHLLKAGHDPTQRASLNDVLEKLEQLRKKRRADIQAREQHENIDSVDLLRQRIAANEARVQEARQKRKERRKRKQAANLETAQQTDDDDQQEMMKMMGFQSFS
eukprot:Partr_v1_DN26647_c3_g1_i1_m69349 putative Zinc finger matrin-type